MVKKNGNHKQKNRALVPVVIIAGILLLFGAMMVFPWMNPFLIENSLNVNIIGREQSDADNITILNAYMADRYTHVIYPEGKERITEELEKVRQIPDPKDRLDATNDYEVNLKAEMEILELHQKIDELREQQWTALVMLQQEQINLLTEILQKQGGAPAGGEAQGTIQA